MTRSYLFRWDGYVMRPVGRSPLAYQKGVTYRMQEEDASTQSRRHYHARLAELWENFPHDSFPSPEHLRKFALIRTGQYHEVLIPASNEMLQGAFVAVAKSFDKFAICVCEDGFVKAYRAISQAKGAMSEDEFNKSKDKVLAYIEDLLARDVEDCKEGYFSIGQCGGR